MIWYWSDDKSITTCFNVFIWLSPVILFLAVKNVLLRHYATIGTAEQYSPPKKKTKQRSKKYAELLEGKLIYKNICEFNLNYSNMYVIYFINKKIIMQNITIYKVLNNIITACILL